MRNKIFYAVVKAFRRDFGTNKIFTFTDDDTGSCGSQGCNPCPSDSVVGEDGECKCNEKCPTILLNCEPGLVKQMLRKGTNKAGECCDEFICVEGKEGEPFYR